jgi:hypothetical protein
MRVHQLEVTEDELGWLYKAVLLARDCAFNTLGSKSAPAVKRWEKLRDKITTEQGR